MFVIIVIKYAHVTIEKALQCYTNRTDYCVTSYSGEPIAIAPTNILAILTSMVVSTSLVTTMDVRAGGVRLVVI